MPEYHSDNYTLQILPTQALLSVRHKMDTPKRRLAVASVHMYGDVAVLSSVQGREWFNALREFGVRLFDLLGVSVFMGYIWKSHVRAYGSIPGVHVKTRWEGEMGGEHLVWVEVTREDR